VHFFQTRESLEKAPAPPAANSVVRHRANPSAVVLLIFTLL
jgi:hypothetical protein